LQDHEVNFRHIILAGKPWSSDINLEYNNIIQLLQNSVTATFDPQSTFAHPFSIGGNENGIFNKSAVLKIFYSK